MRAERRQAWKDLGVDGPGIADHAPGSGHPDGQLPRLTLRMAARLQGFPGTWELSGARPRRQPIGQQCQQAVQPAPGQLTDDAQISWRHSRRFDAGPGLAQASA